MGCYGTPINGRPNIHGFTIGADFNLGREPIFTRRFRYLKFLLTWQYELRLMWRTFPHPQNSRRLRFGIPAFLVPETFGENCSYKWQKTPNTDSPLRQKLESKVCVSPLTDGKFRWWLWQLWRQLWWELRLGWQGWLRLWWQLGWLWWRPGKGRDAWRIIPRSKWLMTKVIGLVH